MSILLNLTDGIIGDVLNIKLICTFNTSLSNIDKALLRKGRLSLKYEFKKLAKEKCRKLLNDYTINEDMTLADLYNKDDENDYSKTNSHKIGF
jgi:ATP-dependent 26S proteasome regulatory subunit